MYDDATFSPTEGVYAKFNACLQPITGDETFNILFGDLGFFNARPFNQGLASVRFQDSGGKYVAIFQSYAKTVHCGLGQKFTIQGKRFYFGASLI